MDRDARASRGHTAQRSRAFVLGRRGVGRAAGAAGDRPGAGLHRAGRAVPAARPGARGGRDRGAGRRGPGAGRPVLWTVVRYTSGLADGGLFVRKVPALAAFAEDAAGGWGELAPPLRPAAGEPVVVKQYASAFFGTSLAATLHASGVDTVVVAGRVHVGLRAGHRHRRPAARLPPDRGARRLRRPQRPRCTRPTWPTWTPSTPTSSTCPRPSTGSPPPCSPAGRERAAPSTTAPGRTCRSLIRPAGYPGRLSGERGGHGRYREPGVRHQGPPAGLLGPPVRQASARLAARRGLHRHPPQARKLRSPPTPAAAPPPSPPRGQVGHHAEVGWTRTRSAARTRRRRKRRPDAVAQPGARRQADQRPLAQLGRGSPRRTPAHTIVEPHSEHQSVVHHDLDLDPGPRPARPARPAPGRAARRAARRATGPSCPRSARSPRPGGPGGTRPAPRAARPPRTRPRCRR